MLQNIDQEKCTGCGSCFKSCGLDVFRLETDQAARPPCQSACPAGVDIRAYVHLLQQGRIGEAARVLMANNPLPALTGRSCQRFCETKCARKKVEEAVNINGLEQYIGDWVLEQERPKPSPVRHTGRIGVIGSGPAGLSCAYYLNQKGYAVTVFEAEKEPGGIFRSVSTLSAGVVKAQAEYLGSLGILFRYGTIVGDGHATTLQGLRGEGYKAFVLAVGAAKDRALRKVPPFSSVAAVSSDALISVNPLSFVTATRHVFAIGHVIGGGKSVAHAIAEGREAAESVDRFINGWSAIEGRSSARPVVENLPGKGVESAPRQSRESEGKKKGKNPVEGFAFEQMILEAQRCMTCGSKARAAYKDDCMTCYTCEMACPQGAIVVHPFKENLPRTIPYPKEGVK